MWVVPRDWAHSGDAHNAFVVRPIDKINLACAQILGELKQDEPEAVEYQLARAACELVYEEGMKDFDSFANQVVAEQGVPFQHRDIFNIIVESVGSSGSAAAASTGAMGKGKGKGKGKGQGKDVMKRPAGGVSSGSAAAGSAAVVLTPRAGVAGPAVPVTPPMGPNMLTQRTHRSLFYAIGQVGAFLANVPGARGSSGSAAASAVAEFSCALADQPEGERNYFVPAWIAAALFTVLAMFMAFCYWRCCRRARSLTQVCQATGRHHGSGRPRYAV